VTVDEAHLFRKLDFATRRGNIKGIDPNGSMRSMDLYMKTRYLEQRKPGRSHVLASGTPITNTMAELFTISRYLQPDELRRAASTGSTPGPPRSATPRATSSRPRAAPTRCRPASASSSTSPSLSVMVRQVMDVVTSAQLEQYVVRPKVKRELILVPQTRGPERLPGAARARMEAIEQRTGKPQKGDDIILTVIGDGRKSAIDMRLVDPSHDLESTKLERLIDNAHKVWEGDQAPPVLRDQGRTAIRRSRPATAARRR
jgi:N12 class adenine-specific DNA methylase